MIITCDECSTSFRLDESLLKDEGSKVRCSLCKHVFTAFPPGNDAILDLETPAHAAMDTPSVPPVKTGQKEQDLPSWERESDSSDSDLFDFDDTDFDDDLDQGKAQADIEISFEDSDNDFDLENGLSFEEEETPGSPDDLTFDEKEITFDEAEIAFDAADMEPVETQSRPDIQAENAEETEELTGIDFQTLKADSRQEPADDDQFSGSDEDLDAKDDLELGLALETDGEEKTDDLKLEQPQADSFREDPEEPGGLDFGLEKEFSAYDEVLDQDTEPQEVTDDTALEEKAHHDFQSKDDLDLEDYDETDLDDQDSKTPGSEDLKQETPAPRRPARASLIQPLDPDAEMGETAQRTRKKARSALSAPVLVLLLLFLLTAGGYVAATSLGYKIPFLSEIKIPFIQQYLPQKTQEPAPAPDPVPDQKSVTGRFVTNDTAGELFIITGKIENPAQISYTNIQVKGTLFQKDKIAAMTQTAFCGNIVSEEVLKSGNIADIIARLKTPDGNEGTPAKLHPGDTVPFMLVFSDLPKNLQNFTVELLGFEKAEK
ncbi:MAG: DUF3426 domain-containing protein [Desulfotignum sp.]|jgi:predicted Zn finger-like uncharacterized protein|nr:DUF3426 domain-containing protein [Desulfotignum sp.]